MIPRRQRRDRQASHQHCRPLQPQPPRTIIPRLSQQQRRRKQKRLHHRQQHRQHPSRPQRRMRIQLRLIHKQPMQQRSHRRRRRRIRIQPLPAQRPRQHLPHQHPVHLPAEEPHRQRRRTQASHHPSRKGLHVPLAQKVAQVKHRKHLQPKPHPHQQASRKPPLPHITPARQRQHQQQQQIVLPIQKVLLQRYAQRRHQRNPPPRQPAHLPQQHHNRRHHRQVQHQPRPLGHQRLHPRQRPYRQRRERRTRHEPHHRLIDRPMILLALQPDPLIHPRGIVALPCQPRRQVVVRKVRIQRLPRRGHRMQRKVSRHHGQQRPLYTPQPSPVSLAETNPTPRRTIHDKPIFRKIHHRRESSHTLGIVISRRSVDSPSHPLLQVFVLCLSIICHPIPYGSTVANDLIGAFAFALIVALAVARPFGCHSRRESAFVVVLAVACSFVCHPAGIYSRTRLPTQAQKKRPSASRAFSYRAGKSTPNA